MFRPAEKCVVLGFLVDVCKAQCMREVQKLDALTGLRFFAAFMIVIHHLQGVLWLPAGMSQTFAFGSGVSFFFVLSGFILHYNYRDKIHKLPWRHFMWMRFFRLWPAHIAALMFAAFMIPVGVSHMLRQLGWVEIGQVVFLLQSLTPDPRVYYAWNGPSWSISTEMFFYAAFPLLCGLAIKRPLIVLAGMAITTAVYLIIAQTLFYDPGIRGNAHGLAGINPLPRLLEFATGIVMCELIVYRRIMGRPAPWMEFAAVATAGFGMWAIASFGYLATPLGPVASHYLRVVGAFPFFCVLIAVISAEVGPVSRFLSLRPVVWLGETSFALYLVHQPAIAFFRRNMAQAEIWQQVPLFIALVLGTSAAVFYLFEKPGIRFSRQMLAREWSTRGILLQQRGREN